MARLALGAIAVVGVAVAVSAAAGSGAGSQAPAQTRSPEAPQTTVRPCRSRAEPGWQPRRSDLVWGYPPRGSGPLRSGLNSYETAKPSAFASRAGDAGFRRYIDGPRGRALPERKRKQLLRLAPHYYGQLKTPFAVKAGHTVTVEVGPREHASFIFDDRRHGRQIGPYWSYRVADGTPRIRLTACAADEPMFSGPGVVGPWTAFPGAMVVAGARCLTFLVRERGRPTIAYVTGFGTSDCRARPPRG